MSKPTPVGPCTLSATPPAEPRLKWPVDTEPPSAAIAGSHEEASTSDGTAHARDARAGFDNTKYVLIHNII